MSDAQRVDETRMICGRINVEASTQLLDIPQSLKFRRVNDSLLDRVKLHGSVDRVGDEALLDETTIIVTRCHL